MSTYDDTATIISYAAYRAEKVGVHSPRVKKSMTGEVIDQEGRLLSDETSARFGDGAHAEDLRAALTAFRAAVAEEGERLASPHSDIEVITARVRGATLVVMRMHRASPPNRRS